MRRNFRAVCLPTLLLKIILLHFILLTIPNLSSAQTFIEVGTSAGVADTSSSYGQAWGDFNADGQIDFYLTNYANGENINKLFKNNGNGTFSDIASSMGLAFSGFSQGPAWADFDNDGDLDLYLANNGTNHLYRNDGTTFSEIGSTAQVLGSGISQHASWADYDNDGDVDIHVVNDFTANNLYRNNDNGTFTDIASMAGVNDTQRGPVAAWGDYNNDGYIDLYTASTTFHGETSETHGNGTNRLYRNNGNGTFTDIASTAGVDVGMSTQSIAWADYDNDGDLDFYMGNSSIANTTGKNILFRNEGNDTFTDVADSSGVAYTGVTQGIGWGDYDNDGDLDIYLGNHLGENNKLYSNNNDGSFTDVSTSTGTADNNPAAGITWADYDNDGDLDLYVANSASSTNRLYRNSGNTNQWLQVTLTGITDNTSAIGTTITVVTGSVRQRRDIDGGSGQLTQSPLTATIGLGTNSFIDSLIIQWPSEDPQTLTNISTNQNLSVTEHTFFDVSIPDTTAIVSDSLRVPIRLKTNLDDLGIIAADIKIAYDNRVLIPAQIPTDLTGTPISNWAIDDNVIPGIGNIDTLAIALSTSQDTLWGPSAAALVYLVFETSATQTPDSTALILSKIRFNEGTPVPFFTYNGSAILQLIGNDATLSTSYVIQALAGLSGLRDTVRIQVTDDDVDTTSGAPDQLTVAIHNLIGADIDTITLTETGNTTGIFQVRVPTIYGTNGTTNDGHLTIAPWDTLSVSYIDAIPSSGPPDTLTNTIAVVNLFGDVRPNNEIQAFDAAAILSASVGLITPSTRFSLVGDVDGSNTLTAFDAMKVRQHAIHLINRFPVQTDTALSLPADPKNHPFLKPVPTDLIAFGHIRADKNGVFRLPILLTERAQINAGDLFFSHNENVEIITANMATDYSDFQIAHNTNQTGTQIAFAGAKSDLEGAGTLLYLSFRLPDATPLIISLDQLTLNGQPLTPVLQPLALDPKALAMPQTYSLYQNLPNPFNPQTTIRYDLPEPTHVKLAIYNITGQVISELISQTQPMGRYEVVWNGTNTQGQFVSSGIYFLHMDTPTFEQTRKMILLR